MNKIKTFTHKNKKYKYTFCDIYGLIDFFKSNIIFTENFEKLLKAHRPGDIDFKYTKIINEDLQIYWFDKAITYYQIIWNPENLDLVTIARANLLENNNNTKECILSMIHTNFDYRNLQFCQKNISMFLLNIKKINTINKFVLYVDKDNIPAIKCYEKCGFEIKELVKNKAYLMETN